MPALNAEDRAALAADAAEMIADGELVTLARAPKGMRNRGDAEAFATNVPMQIWSTNGNSDPRILEAVPAIGGQRVAAVGYASAGTDLQAGDEIWTASKRYSVLGVGIWRGSVAAALNEIVPRAS